MKGYCLIIRARTVDHNQIPPYRTRIVAKNAIRSVSLIDADESCSPITSIKKHCRERGLLNWPIDEWDEHKELIEWFTVRDIERLKSIVWRDPGNELEEQVQLVDKIEVYRAFKIRQVTFLKALDELNNEVINRARGLGWEPRRLVNALDMLAWSMEEKEQAEVYREGILDMIEDTVEAVEAAESIYEYDAEMFLEEEEEPVKPKFPRDMTDEELIEEATRLHGTIFTSDNFGTEDLRRHNAMEVELLSRHYKVVYKDHLVFFIAGTDTATEQEEE